MRVRSNTRFRCRRRTKRRRAAARSMSMPRAAALAGPSTPRLSDSATTPAWARRLRQTGEGKMAEAQPISVAPLRAWLGDGGEIAFIDVREEGPHADGHPLLAI